jgi:hypothetical protein
VRPAKKSSVEFVKLFFLTNKSTNNKHLKLFFSKKKNGHKNKKKLYELHGTESPPSLTHFGSDCSHTLKKKKGKEHNDIFISIVNKLEHKSTKFHVCLQLLKFFLCKVKPPT